MVARGPVIETVLWKKMYRGILVYKVTTVAENTAIPPYQVRRKIDYLRREGHIRSIDSASIILADIFDSY